MIAAADIAAWAQAGESSLVEFKTEDVAAEALAAELAAFANSAGGRILLGVADDGAIVGCRRAGLEEFVVNVCRNNIRPGIIPTIERVTVGDRVVMVVSVPRSATVHTIGGGRYYIRVGATRQAPSQPELVRLYQHRRLLALDESPVAQAAQDSLDLGRVRAFLERLGAAPLPDTDPVTLARDLANLGIVIEVEPEESRPTLAGLLCFGRDPQRYCRSFAIRAGAYRGRDLAGETIAERDLGGTLADMIEGAMAFVKLTMPQLPALAGARRDEGYAYPLAAVREALVNAVCHRDYGIEGAAVRLFLFTDRLEVRSPGGLPNTQTAESIFFRQFARNQTIASFLAGLGYMEQRGRGMARMRQLCRDHGLRFACGPDPDHLEFTVSFQLADDKENHHA